MAPRTSKQADRKAAKKDSKADDEPAAAGSSAGLVDAVKELAFGSVLLEVMPMLSRLMKETDTEPNRGGAKEEPDSQEAENKENEESNGDAAKAQDKTKNATGVFDDLVARMPVMPPDFLGLDKNSEEAWALFTGLQVDGGPYKRKKGNAAMERIQLNVERNMSQYLNISLVLMCLRAVVFRSWFACLPWLAFYQFLSLSLDLDLRNYRPSPSFPEALFSVAPKLRVAGTMVIHALVWLFFLLEVVWQSYFFEKFLLIVFIAIHAYVVVPEVNLEAARKLVAEKKTAEKGEAKPPAAGDVNFGSMMRVLGYSVSESFLVRQSTGYLRLQMMVQAAIKKAKNGNAEKTQEEKERDEKEAEDKQKTGGDDDETILAKSMSLVTVFNPLALGLPTSPQDAWRNLPGLKLDFGAATRERKSQEGFKERVMTNVERNMPQYIHILFVLMCLRSFLFRSWFACLPWMFFYQTVVTNVDMIRAKIPQVPPVDVAFQCLAATVCNGLVWLFFVYEFGLMTGVFEKFLLVGLIVAHAYVVVPRAA